MDGSFDRQVIAKLPLAEAVLVVMRHVFDTADLTSLYEANRGRSYSKRLGFAIVVQVFWDCLTGRWKSVREGLINARDEGRLPVSLVAFYQKVAGTPLEVSRSLFRVCSAKIRELFPEEQTERPECLNDYAVVVLDGKKIKHVQRRRPELRLDRHNASKLLGGCALVARDRYSGLAFDLEVDPDGEANDVKYVPALLQSVSSKLSRYVIVADRAFGVFEICRQILAHHGDFVLRQHGATKFIANPDVAEVRTTDRFGRTVVQRWGWITRGKQTKKAVAERIAVRQLTVERDQENLVLITSLSDADVFPIDALLDAYLDRWEIEKMFQVVTEVFDLKQLASTSPQGTLLQFVLCLLAYNVIQLVKQYIARGKSIPEPRISSEMLFRDIAKQLIAIAEIIPAQRAAALLPSIDVKTARRRLHELLDDCWHDRWKTANYRPPDPSRPIKSKTKRVKQTKSHDSVHRILKRERQ